MVLFFSNPKAGSDKPTKAKENNKKTLKEIVHQAIKHVSKKLNNTPSISKKAYVDNKLFQVIINNPKNFVNKIPEDNLHKYLLLLIKKYYD